MKTILVIDDSATIRRLVDSTLSRGGYSVILASTAEDGLALAEQHIPEMILLDHQLPGTTGLEVSKQLVGDANLRRIPVVVSSTLRKRAYVEYADLANVVDMLPKPYTEELLLTTVANALDTGSLVVESQSQGTAVPEVINELTDNDLCGTFDGFSIREVLDFLNNGKKNGTLEVESADNQKRYSIFLENGRVLGVSAKGIAASEVIDRLPASLQEFAPVLNVTMSQGCSALDSIIQLLDTEVLDPRLLRKLLRHQAAVLLVSCFGQRLKSFRFESQRVIQPLFQRLPLDVSVLALLVEGAHTCPAKDIPAVPATAEFARQPIRGQNLDRAGLSAKQSRLLGQLTTTRSLAELANAVSASIEEVRTVLYGLELAELVSCVVKDNEIREVILFESNLDLANAINEAFAASESYRITTVTDIAAAKILARRTSPSVIVVDGTIQDGLIELRSAVRTPDVKWVTTTSDGVSVESGSAALARPYNATKLLDLLDELIVPREADIEQAHGTEGNLCMTY